MPGIGINTIRRGMAIKNKGLSVLQKVGNGIVQRRKTWLPYVGILVCLGAVWFLWEEPQGQVNMKRDASQQQAEKHPVFDTPEKEAEGSLVYDVRPAIQYKPLLIYLAAVCRRKLSPRNQKGTRYITDCEIGRDYGIRSAAMDLAHCWRVDSSRGGSPGPVAVAGPVGCLRCRRILAGLVYCLYQPPGCRAYA